LSNKIGNYLKRQVICCQGYGGGDLSRYKWDGLDKVVEHIKKKDMPYTCDSEVIMICSPVGNQAKYEKDCKADIALSGYSTARNAAIKYLSDPIDDWTKECRHSFNTSTMKRGILELMGGIGFENAKDIFKDSIDPGVQPKGIKFLFTQMLCMINLHGSSKAVDVDKALKLYPCIRRQAESSLTGWYLRIKNCLKTGGTILIMGKNAWDLLNSSWIKPNGEVMINFTDDRKLDSETLYSKLSKNFCVYEVMHAAGIVRSKNNFQKWLNSKNGNLVKKHIESLKKNFIRSK